MAANAMGLIFDKWQVYAEVMGQPYAWPGQPASFAQLDQAAAAAAALMGRQLVRWNGSGAVDDVPAFLNLAREQRWFLAAGVAMQDLVIGDGYYHYLLVRGLEGYDVLVVDSFRYADGGSDRYDLPTFEKAMADNWDSLHDAYAWRWAA